MKNFIFNIIFVLIFLSGYAYPQEILKPQDIGLKIKQGGIDKSKLTTSQRDTIVTGYFNFEDWLEDIAIYYRSKGEIKIFRNGGNGYFNEWREIKTNRNDIKSIESCAPDNSLYNQNQRWGLKINYSDGKSEIIENKELANVDSKQSKMPLREFFNDTKGLFLYEISFVEQWRSEMNGSSSADLSVGDYDKDGKNEAVYTFWPSGGNPYPTRMIVFECYNQNQYRIEWDTIFQLGGCCLSMPMSDFDNDGHNEFWARTYDGFSGYQKLAIYECYGDGIYKHRYLSSNVSFDLPFGIVLKDSVTINGITRRGLWGCFLDYENTIITQMRFDQKSSFNSTLSSYQFVEEPIGGIKVPGTYTSLAAEDFDNDGKIEIVIGGAGGHFVYLDSTGTGPYAMKGYELKDIYFNEPAGGSWLVSKDLDNDGRKEFIGCGVGLGTGSFCVIKHTGSPGSNQWAVKYWDTVGIVAMPFMGIDSGSIDNKFSILYPTIRYDGALDFLNLITFTKNGTYSFYKSFKMIKDSAAMFKAKFIDIDNDEKINILSPMFLEGPPWKNYLVDFEQVGTININPIGTEVPSTFNLYQNYPNPFNPSTKIKFAIPSDVKCETSEVKMVIYDITGKKITTLVNEKLNPGTYEVTFDGSNLPSGIYFYKLNAGNFSETKRMILIK